MRLPYAQVVENRALDHQIVLHMASRHGSQLTVGCNCTHGTPIASKPSWAYGETLATYRSYHDDQHRAAHPLPDGQRPRPDA